MGETDCSLQFRLTRPALYQVLFVNLDRGVGGVASGVLGSCLDRMGAGSGFAAVPTTVHAGTAGRQQQFVIHIAGELGDAYIIAAADRDIYRLELADIAAVGWIADAHAWWGVIDRY